MISFPKRLGIYILVCLPSIQILAQDENTGDKKTAAETVTEISNKNPTQQVSQDKLNELSHQFEEAKAAQAKLEAELQETKQRYTTLLAERDQLQSQLASTQQTLATAQQENQTLGSQLESAKTELTNTQQTLQATQRENQTLGSQLEEVKTKLEEAQTRTHTVRPGESLSAIATLYYRDIDRWTDILEANRSVIIDPDVLEAGMVLVIPELDR
jgi:nucleoid-associated protein YgaU